MEIKDALEDKSEDIWLFLDFIIYISFKRSELESFMALI